MGKGWLNELITFVARQTGWNLEYICRLPYAKLRILASELQYQKELDEYNLASCFGMVIATWANAQTKAKRFKVQDFVGNAPRRKSIGGKNLAGKIENTAIILGDGNEYHLAPLNANMMVEIEDSFNLAFFEMFESGKVRMKYVRFLLTLMLRENYPDMTEQNVGKLLTTKVIADAYGKIIGTVTG